MKNSKLTLFSTICLLELLPLGFSPQAWAAATSDSAIELLLTQAQYWHEKSNDSLATESLQKVFMVDASNPQALYLMALWAEERGDNSEAKRWKDRLSNEHPDAPQIQALARSRALQQLPKQGLDAARQQAATGDINGAITTWNNLFQGAEPPVSLVPEYYLTMSGDSKLYPQAVEKLAKFAKDYPNDTAITTAYGQVLTYRDNTRRAGISVLERVASSYPQADQSLRQALMWLTPTVSDKQSYDRWTDRHLSDSDVMAHYNQSVSGGMTRTGFNELNSGNIVKAKRSFQAILSTTPNDTEALAGMGYVYLHQGDYVSAAKYLNRSAEQGGDQAQKRRSQAEEAQFYGKLSQAKEAYKQGNSALALQLTGPLIGRGGEAGTAVKLFRADVLRHDGDYAQAENLLRRVLDQQPNNLSAKEALYYVLIEQNDTSKAEQLLATMPQELQGSIQAKDSYGNMHSLAKQAVDAGNIETAIAILDNGLQRLPNNPWLRLELARLHQQQGENSLADDVILPLKSDDASYEDLYAAALYERDLEQWRQVNELLGRIPDSKRDSKVNELYSESRFYLTLDLAQSYLTQGDKPNSLATLSRLKPDVVGHPLWAGKLAQILVKSGDENLAVEVVNASINEGIKGNAGDYADQVAVLYQVGRRDDAQNILNDPQLLANSTPLQLARARNVYVINEADRLRKQGDFAPAYDLLTRALQDDSQNTDLMLAMARLYLSGKMTDSAEVVYHYLLDSHSDTEDQEALVGAINVALAKGEIEKATTLSAELNDTTSPQRLLLMARIYEASGHHEQALASLRTARGKLLGLSANYQSTSPMIGGLVLADNPFTDTQASQGGSQSSSVYSKAMPWQVEGKTSLEGQVITQRSDLPELTHDQQTLSDVNKLLVQVSEKSSSWVQGGVTVKGRDGESGLSKLTEARAPLQWSTVPFGDARLTINLDAVSLDAGSSSGDASRRFGTGALIQGEVAESEGLSTLDGDTLPDVDSQGAQSYTGVELGVGLQGEYFNADIGTTPLGLELTTLVGGVQWRAPMSDYLSMTFTGERRAVKDSLLSYVGVKDSFSGQYWGQVTQNGLKAELNYDDGDAGYYTNIGSWRYLGSNVADNNSLDIGAGAYLRPYRVDNKELQVGVNLSYKDFDQNLSYYSFGHGGYFSPQNYVSFSFPVDFTQSFSNLKLSLGGAIGYQSYSQDSVAYFPGQSALQSALESYVDSGYAEEAYYDGESVAGVGYNFHAGIEYRLQPDMTIEARILYDTFRDYNESSAQIVLRRSFSEY